MKAAPDPGSLAPFKSGKRVRFKLEEDEPTESAEARAETGSNDDVKQDDSTAPSDDASVVQGVKPNVVLVEGIKCRSLIKCKASPGGGAGAGVYVPRVLCCSQGTQVEGNKQIFHTLLFLEDGLWPPACLHRLLLHSSCVLMPL